MSFIQVRKAPPIESEAELLAFFEHAGKPEDRHRVGIELEKLAANPRTGEAITYEGSDGIDAVLRRMARFPCYEPTYEGERLVLLTCGSRTIGLEPGGQIELSGTPYARLAHVGAELELHLRELCEASIGLPLAWLAIGEHPIAPLASIPWVEKERYRIMADYLAPAACSATT
ncbi:MAG: glutamate-cysteine ligase family protein [Acidobacteriota bacterium]